MQRVLVCLKRVVDYNVRVRLKPDGSGVILDGVKMSINPFDEIALEEALRIRERGQAEEVVVVSLGTTNSQQQLRTGLAMGADRAILIETADQLAPLTVAQALKALVEREEPGLVLLGKQAIDADNNQTAQMLAALWDRPQATFVSELTEPRYVKLPDIMKAKKKPLDTIPLADLGCKADTQFKVTHTDPPPEREKGIMVDDIAGLVAELGKRGLVDG
jgi:electron transfer flavoprotein beta subunit